MTTRQEKKSNTNRNADNANPSIEFIASSLNMPIEYRTN